MFSSKDCSHTNPATQPVLRPMVGLLLAGFSALAVAQGVSGESQIPSPQGASAPAPVAEDAGPARPAPMLTAPAMGTHALSMGASDRSNKVQGGDEIAGGTFEADVSVPWTLTSDQAPWPLTFPAQLSLPVLYLNLPHVNEVRLMLPGRAADKVADIRSEVSKYLNDTLGLAAQSRGRQLQTIQNWIDTTEKQRRTLSGDAWQAYQFARDSRPKVEAFRAAMVAQIERDTNEVLTSVRRAIDSLQPLVQAMPTAELQNALYAVMVQLRDGGMLYQRQVQSADNQVLGVVDGYLRNYPPAMRPAGPVPTDPALRPVNTPVSANPAAPRMTSGYIPAPVSATPAPPAITQAEQPGGFGGSLILIIVGAISTLFVWAKLRKAKTAGPAAK